MVKDGRKKVTTISNNLPAGAKDWRNHFSCSSKICLAERQEKWSFVDDWKILAEYFPDQDDHQLPERSFMLGVWSTLKPGEMKNLIKNTWEKCLNRKSDLDENLIAITPAIKEEIWQLLPQKSYFELLLQKSQIVADL